jgi:hypothetical protein
MTKSLCTALIVSALLLPRSLLGDEVLEKAGIGIGLTVGNILAVPAKAVSVSMGLAAGLLSFIFTGGDTEVMRQSWQNSTEGPYLITPEVAHRAIGERPELEEKYAPANKY